MSRLLLELVLPPLLLSGVHLSPAPQESLARAIPATSHHHDSMLGRRDLVFALAGAAAVALVATHDRFLTEESVEANSTGERRLERAVQPFGNGGVVIPTIAGVYTLGLLTRQPELSRATARTGIAVGGAGAVALVLKELVGRARPDESPDQPWNLKPFSSHHSFPSGHATLAFAAASALREETHSRWLPWVAYPLAGLVGWSRVHANEHWTSDVVAGALIGTWMGDKLDRLCRRQHRFGFLRAARD